MSFADCVDTAIEGGFGSKEQGERAQALWKERAAMYERQGYKPHLAEVLAAEDVKTALKKEAGEIRHMYLARVANMNRLRLEVGQAKNLDHLATRSLEILDFRTRALKRRFDGKVAEYLQANHRDILGRDTDKATMLDVVRELHGEATGNANAKALADGIGYALEDMRKAFNEAGGVIGKLDDWGLPHSHSRSQILRAGISRLAEERGVSAARIKAEMAVPIKGEAVRQEVFTRSFDQWFDDIHGKIDWTKMEDFQSGLPFQADGASPPPIDMQRRFLREIFDGIAYGDAVPQYGKTQGMALYRARARSRVLHFKSADDWITYNRSYGSGDPHKSLMAHVHGMAKDIAAMREFGPNPEMGLDFYGQLINEKAKADNVNPWITEKNVNHAKRMMKVERGGAQPSGYWGELSAGFFSDTRRVLTSALLERASIASIADLNSMQVAARSIGANPRNAISAYVDTVSAMVKEGHLTTDEMLQMQWITDTMADPGVAAARFEAEMPSSEWSERLSSFVMRASGLSSHTDAARFALQKTWGAHLANQMSKAFDDIEPGVLKILREHGITADDWVKFANDEWAFQATNGAKFLDPLYWRAATDMDASVADDLFLKFQGAAEDFIELGVPTQSLFMRGAIDPAAWGLNPGSAPYELMKSTLMFKSFVMSFTFNQYRILQRLPTTQARIAHLGYLIGGATAIGAVSVQLTEIVKGNDPMPMDNGVFWGKAMLKGGGFGIVGDIIATGETTWGGGFKSYVAGPMVQLADETWDLTVSNLTQAGVQFMKGEDIDTGFVKELSRFGRRYTPAKDLPFLGPAFDRLVMDQMQIMLDPESIDALHRKARDQQNLYGNGSWWMPGSPLPDRAPNFNPADLFQP